MPTFSSIPFAFVDVETTGTSAQYGKIIELAIFRVEDGKVVDQLITLLDPGEILQNEIIRLTGISNEDLESAPTFRQVADQALQLLEGAIFVAHNARFDYAFVKSEFNRINVPWSCETLCTAKLFRKLRPDLRHYNLDVLIQEYDIQCDTRHRAGPDALALVNFFERASSTHGEHFWNTIGINQKNPCWPSKLTHLKAKDIPESPGVYIFKDEDGTPIYIGKSTNLRNRVLSHFSDVNGKELKIAQIVADIEFIKTAGELSALITESRMIKEYLPLYNRKLRKNLQMIAAIEEVDDDGYKTINFTEKLDDQIPPQLILGTFRSKRAAISTFTMMAEKYKLCPVKMGLVKGDCFWYQIDKCDGACQKDYPAWKYNSRFDEATNTVRVSAWPYPGPVTINEQNQALRSTWKVDQWCVLEHLEEDNEGNTKSQSFERLFDWDTYKILKKFSNESAKMVNVRKLENDWTTDQFVE